jgi:Protein of unknown function (DUF1236)
MLNRFMITAATVALIAGTGFANAQGTGSNREGPSGGSAVQSQAPTGSSAAPAATEPNKPSGMKATQSEDKMQGSKNQRAQDDMKAGAKGEKSAQDNMKGETKGEKSKSMSSETDNAKGAKDMKAEDRNTKMNSAQSKEGMSKDGMSKDGMSKDGMSKDGVNNAQSRSSTESKTTGNAATSATAAPPPEKQTQISSAIRSERVEEVTNVNFDISVGARIPTSVRFHTLPSRIVEIYPEWRGYEFILVRGRYIIVRPQTHEIVYIIEG